MDLGHDLNISVLLCDEPCEILKVEIFIPKKDETTRCARQQSIHKYKLLQNLIFNE